jgi:exodeoxyribonuclease V alpha subunit
MPIDHDRIRALLAKTKTSEQPIVSQTQTSPQRDTNPQLSTTIQQSPTVPAESTTRYTLGHTVHTVQANSKIDMSKLSIADKLKYIKSMYAKTVEEYHEEIVENLQPQQVDVSAAPTQTDSLTIPKTTDWSISIDKYGNQIHLNAEQQEAVKHAAAGESFVLIGAAGSGKTTTMRQVNQAIIESGKAGLLTRTEHTYLTDNTPGIVTCAYTRRAVANIQRAVSDDMKNNCITIHKLLEYQPVYETVTDPETGDDRTTMRFEATRNRYNPLPESIRVIEFEEASMISVELFMEVLDACPHNPQFVFLGDIQQLPPVFGSAILGFKMLELPTIELVQIYRQALESPIIRLAHRILSGNPIPANEYAEWKKPGQLTLHPWKKVLDADTACLVAAKFFTAAIDSNAYDPEADVILCPFNKSFGTDELNKHIAQHLALKRGAVVYEVIAGFNKYYYSVGDKVLVEKEDAIITAITRNPDYLGVQPAQASTTLDYWGAEQGTVHHVDAEMSDDDIDRMMELAASDSEDRVRQCSHTITVTMQDTGRELKISTASGVNAMILAYCLTIHKSQGSEWRKVFLVLHRSHATMIQRELLYTACTRAREELYVICEPETFTKGILGQRIKGNTLAEKAEFFKGKVESGYLKEKIRG